MLPKQSHYPLINKESNQLSAGQFEALRDVPPETEWFANITNPNTRRAYKGDVKRFMSFLGIGTEHLHQVSRAHVIAWRESLKQLGNSETTIKRKLAAISSLYQHLCDQQLVQVNPAKSVQRPKKTGQGVGATPALSVDQVRSLLSQPDTSTLLGLRDQAILSVLLYHGLRRAELCALKISDIQQRQGVFHLLVHGKGGKDRFIPLHPHTAQAINQYLHHKDYPEESPGLFLSGFPGKQKKHANISPDGLYFMIKRYAEQAGIESARMGVHTLRSTAATTALKNGAALEEVQFWLGHSDPKTTQVYDYRKQETENSPTFKVAY